MTASRRRTILRALQRVYVERRAGAPWRIIRVYVEIELRHGWAHHDGHPEDCLTCYAALR